MGFNSMLDKRGGFMLVAVCLLGGYNITMYLPKYVLRA